MHELSIETPGEYVFHSVHSFACGRATDYYYDHMVHAQLSNVGI